MNELERFHACMDYQPVDRTPNHELGVWPQTRDRWRREAPSEAAAFTWNWFDAEDAIGLDRREYVPMNYGMMPGFEAGVLEETDEYEIIRHGNGIISKALKEGTVDGGRMSMDQYLEHPVKGPADWPDVKRRLDPFIRSRYPADLDAWADAARARTHPLILGHNCAATGFYWRAREFMGTENLSYAWHDEPALMHEIMETFADLVIETSRPVLEKVQVDYFVLNEDMSMKSGPLLSPATFRTFIYPHLCRMVEFFHTHGTRYFAVDTDGDPTPLVPLLMDAGVDILWPIERASNVDPVTLRKRFGRSLRLWGGVDKRVLPEGGPAIRAHLREMIPLIEEGGFIPTIDHTVPPDVSWDNFRIYMDAKRALLAGDFGKLE